MIPFLHTHTNSLSSPLGSPFPPTHTRPATRKAFCVCQGVGQCKSITPSSNSKAVKCVCACVCAHALHKETGESFVMYINLCYAITWHCSPRPASHPSLFFPLLSLLPRSRLAALFESRQAAQAGCLLEKGSGVRREKGGVDEGGTGEQRWPQWTAVT